MLKGDAHSRYPETFVAGLKNGVLEGTLKAVGVNCIRTLNADLIIA